MANPDLQCTACFANQQILDAGTFDKQPEVAAIIEDQVYSGTVVVIHESQGLCEAHFNLKRHWPADFPDTPLPKSLVSKLSEMYDGILEDDHGIADRPPKRRRRRR